MISFATAVFTAAAGIWVGAIVFQTAVVAPSVFANLDEAEARIFLRALFPRFYRLGLVCGALMLAGSMTVAVFAGWSSTPLILVVASSGMLLLEAISLRMVPSINAARDEGEAGRATFSALHRVSVLLTVVILILGLAVLVMVAKLAAVGAS